MLPDHSRHIPVEIKLPMRKADGGLASSAKHVAAAGEGGDTMLVHVNKAEFEMLRKQWGDPQINEKTGLPSYSWGDWLGPIAGILGSATGIGGSIGDAIGGATGLFDTGGALSGAIGSGLLGAGVGALGGGGRGALYGGLAGAATPYLSNMITGNSGTGAIGSLGGLFGNGGNLTGAAADNFVGKMGDAAQGPTLSGATADMNGGSTGLGASGGGGGIGSLFSGKGGAMPLVLAGLVAANAFGGKKGPSADSQAAKAANDANQAKFNTPLPQVNFSRTLNPLQGDPRRYGFGPTQNRFTNNGLGFARGGLSSMSARTALPNQQHGPVSGPGTGRSDSIPAQLSDSEYVVDAETTALLGDGSPKAGAAKLDQMRENIRRHKGGALAQGQISPNAHAPEQYMGGRR